MNALVLFAICAIVATVYRGSRRRRASTAFNQLGPGAADTITSGSNRGTFLGPAMLTGGILLVIYVHLMQAGHIAKTGAVGITVLGGLIVLVSAFRRKLAELESEDTDQPPPMEPKG